MMCLYFSESCYEQANNEQDAFVVLAHGDVVFCLPTLWQPFVVHVQGEMIYGVALLFAPIPSQHH